MTERTRCVHISYADNVFRFIKPNPYEEDARDIVQTAFENFGETVMWLIINVPNQ